MKTFGLLWLFPVAWFLGGNKEIETTEAASEADAIRIFRARVPNLPDNGYLKHENGGAWCVAEQLSAF